MKGKSLFEKLALLPFGRIILSGVLFIAALAPIVFGAAPVWAYTLIEIIVFALLLLFLFRNSVRGHWPDFTELKLLWIFVGCFFLVVIFQLIPLPAEVLAVISPSSLAFFKRAIPEFVSGEGIYMWRCLSFNPYETKVYLVKYLTYLGVFFLCAYGLKKERNIEMVIIVLMAVGCFEVLYGLYERFENQEIFGYPKRSYLDSVTGTYINRNHFAGFLGMVITLSTGYLYGKFSHETHNAHTYKDKIISFLNSPDALKYGLLSSAIIIMIIGVFFSLSRMGMISLFLSLLLMAFIAYLGKKVRMAFLGLGLLLFSVGVIVLQGTDQLEKRIETVESSALSRLALWESTVELVGDYPLFGTGLGAFESGFRTYAPDLGNKRQLFTYNRAHNDYLELVAGMGIIGSLPVVAAIIFLFMLFHRKWLERKNSFSNGVALGGLGAFTYMLLHSLADFNLHIPANAVVFAMILGITYAVLNIKHRSRRRRK